MAVTSNPSFFVVGHYASLSFIRCRCGFPPVGNEFAFLVAVSFTFVCHNLC